MSHYLAIFHSQTGSDVLIGGMGLQTFSAPLHKFILLSKLVEGEVAMAVRFSLPVEGRAAILGNNLASGCMWCDLTSLTGSLESLCSVPHVMSSSFNGDAGSSVPSCKSVCLPSVHTILSYRKLTAAKSRRPVGMLSVGTNHGSG